MAPIEPARSGRLAGSERAVSDGLERTRERIVAAGGNLDRVTIVAVTKGFGPEAPLAAVRAGFGDIGENYADELLAKAAQLEADGRPELRWHFLGRLQRNKIPRLAPVVACWQSVGRVEEAVAIARRSPRPEIFVEVDVSSSKERPGCAPRRGAGTRGGGRRGGLSGPRPHDRRPTRRRKRH